MKLGVFVSGTSTGVGKTLVSSLIVSSLKSFSIRTGYYKPIQTGSDLDTPTVAQLTGMPISKFPAPTYQFPEPLAPFRAAQKWGQTIQFERIQKQWDSLDDRAWIIEGAGGLLVPLTPSQTVRDLIGWFDVKLVLVASTALGTINHTLLSIESARAAGISIAGIVLVGDEDPGLDSLIEKFSGVPVLTRIPRFSSVSAALIQDTGSNYFTASVLSRLFE